MKSKYCRRWNAEMISWRNGFGMVFESKHYDTPQLNGVYDFSLLSDQNLTSLVYSMTSFIF